MPLYTQEPETQLDIRDFGAIGNGVADDTASIQAAIDAAASRQQCRVFVPSGYWRVSQLVLLNGVYLIGTGTKKQFAPGGITGSWIKQLPDINDNMIILDPGRVAAWQESSGIIGIRFTGDDSNTSGSGLHTEGVRIGEDFHLRYCWFEDFADDGITLDAGTQPGMITNVHLFRNGRYGINASRGVTDIWQSFELANISGDSNALALIRLHSGMNSMISGSSFLIRNVKSEVGVLGTQANTIILDTLNASLVTLHNINVILTGTSTGANSIVQIVGSRANLNWSGFSCDSDSSPVRSVTYFVDDVVNSITIAPAENTFSGRYGSDMKMWNKIIAAASTTSKASLNLPSGTAPSSPVDGDMWYDGTNLKVRLAGTTRTVTVT